MTFLRDTNGLKPWEERMLREREREEENLMDFCHDCGAVRYPDDLRDYASLKLCDECFEIRQLEDAEE